MRLKTMFVAVGITVLTTGCTSVFRNSQAPILDQRAELVELGKNLNIIRGELEIAEMCLADPNTKKDADSMNCAVRTSAVPSVQSDTSSHAWQMAREHRSEVRAYTNVNLRAYVRLRVTQVDALCGLFFDELSQVKNQTRYGRDLFNIGAEFATVALGVSGSPAEQLAALSGIQLSVNDTFDASERAMLLSPDPHKVFLLVKQTQDGIDPPTLQTFAEADTYVRDYARPCTFLGIQTVIDRALREELERNEPGGRLADLNAVMDEVLEVVNGSDGTLASLAGQGLPLYWLFVLAPTGAEEQSHVMALLPSDTRSAVASVYADAAKREEIGALLQDLDTRAPAVPRSARAAKTAYDAEQKQKAADAAERVRVENALRLQQAEVQRALQEQRLADAQARVLQAQKEADDAAAARIAAESAAAGSEEAGPAVTDPDGST
ncbi:hypothetical protein ACETKC_01765 [Brevundimonas intermedia]|uniref:hypothetical protein n=1 Tax=Brevundimonas intermedia TaxID=74315 RepID=UPI0035A722AF